MCVGADAYIGPVAPSFKSCGGRWALTPPRWCGGYPAAGWGQPALPEKLETMERTDRVVRPCGGFWLVHGVLRIATPVTSVTGSQWQVCKSCGGRRDTWVPPYRKYL